ncbi:MAG: hypothetical protein LBT74_03495 [Acidobacteriota bacterium]|jgi:hypothetical protein|nr:hypothetical protein [Acidobacteriota bacterium]
MNPEYPNTLRTYASPKEVDADLIFSGLGYFLPVPQEVVETNAGKRVLQHLFRHPEGRRRDVCPEDGRLPDAEEVAATGRCLKLVV